MSDQDTQDDAGQNGADQQVPLPDLEQGLGLPLRRLDLGLVGAQRGVGQQGPHVRPLGLVVLGRRQPAAEPVGPGGVVEHVEPVAGVVAVAVQ